MLGLCAYDYLPLLFFCSVAVVGPLLLPVGDVVLLFPAGLPIGWRHAHQ